MGGETSFPTYTFACVNRVIELAATCMGETQQSEITQLSTAGFNSLHAEVITHSSLAMRKLAAISVVILKVG